METRVVNFTKTGKPTTHGTGTNYNRGCRCEPCVLHNRERASNTKKRLEREMREGLKEPKHGITSTYINYGCRCEPCKKAHADSLREQQASRVRRMSAGDESVKSVVHGIGRTYRAWGCRCEPCTAAASEDSNNYRDQTLERIEAGEYVIEKHGSSWGYNLGCRCEECQTWKKVYDKSQSSNKKAGRERRRKQFEAGELEIKHGTLTAYTSYRCRCEECKAVNQEYGRQYRARKKEQQ